VTSSRHFERTFGGHLGLSVRELPSPEIAIVSLGEPKRDPDTPFEEAKRAAAIIAEEAKAEKLEILLVLDGGVEAECMLEAFFRAGAKCRAIVPRFTDGSNEEDVRAALLQSGTRGIPFELLDIDTAEFLKSDLSREYGAKYGSEDARTLLGLKIMATLRGFPVFPWKIPAFRWKSGKNALSIELPNEEQFACHRFLDAENRPGVGFFFLYTPELYYSFYKLESMRDLLALRNVPELNLSRKELKIRILREAGFELGVDARTSTGFERVEVRRGKPTFSRVLMKWIERADLPQRPMNLDYPDELRSIVESLVALGCEQTPHSGRTLLHHLIGTYRILGRWKEPLPVLFGGLCHSLYGTPQFKHATLTLERRETLRALLGEEAERLVYLFCALERRSFMDNLDRQCGFQSWNRFESRTEDLSISEFQGLVAITLANLLDQSRQSCVASSQFELKMKP
jgi:hypothetical protein